MLGPDTPDPIHHLHLYIAYLRVPSARQPGEDNRAIAYIDGEGKSILTRRHNDTQLQVYLTGASISERLERIQRGDVGAERRSLQANSAGLDGNPNNLSIRCWKTTDDFYCQHEGFVKMDSWSRGRGRVTLLGDAGYCSSTNGYGTSSAMTGAYILIGELLQSLDASDSSQPSKDRGIKVALDAYEEKLKPLIAQMQEVSATEGTLTGFHRSPGRLRSCTGLPGLLRP